MTISGTTDKESAHTHTRGTMEIKGTFALAGGGWYSGATKTGVFTVSDSGLANCKSSGDNDSALVTFTASRNWTGKTSGGSAHSHSFSSSAIIGSGDVIRPNSQSALILVRY